MEQINTIPSDVTIQKHNNDDSTANIMTSSFVAVNMDYTVSSTIQYIRENTHTLSNLYYIYIVDKDKRLQGVISLKDLMRQKPNIILKDFMVTMIHTVTEDADQEKTAELLRKHHFLAVPVTDTFRRLVGIVTIDNAMSVIREEHDEDVLNMNAIHSSDKSKTYLKNSIFYHVRSRVPWLVLLLITGTLTTNVINTFSSILVSAAYLVWFIPVLTSTGGNTATQSSALIIQGLARNELSFKNVIHIVAKEAIIAMLLGLILGIVMLTRGIFFPPVVTLLQAFTISLSLIFVVLFSALIGVLSPLIISRMGFDPTVIASPLIATTIDLLGLSIYFNTAKIMLGL